MTTDKQKLKQATRTSILGLALLGVVMFLYLLTVLWRVSWAEQQQYGTSYVLPLSFQKPIYDEPPTNKSFGSPTFKLVKDGTTTHVHKQLINGFQHAFGSALISYELGALPSDLIFRANEYIEAYLSPNGKTLSLWIDTRKDLANNKVGRKIGKQARRMHLLGSAAEQYMMAETLLSLQNGSILPHYLDRRVQALPTVEDYGCPGLPAPEKSDMSLMNTLFTFN